MTLPTIPTVANGRVLVTTQANTTSPRTFPTLTNLTKNSGDLLLAIIVGYQSSLTSAIYSSWGASFTELKDIGVSSQHCLGVAYKWSDGTETGTFTVAQAGTITGHAAMILLSIPNAHLSTVPEILAALATDTTAAADPGSLDPSGWGTEDTLWIAVGGSGETSTSGTYAGVTAAPTNYSDFASTAISADATGGVQAAVAFRQLNAASVDVGTFTTDLSNARNCATVIAVRGAAPVAKSGTESGTGTDTATVSQAKSGTESGTGTDTASLAAAVASSGSSGTVTQGWYFGLSGQGFVQTEAYGGATAAWSDGWLLLGSSAGDAAFGKSLTWEAMGVPAGTTISRVRCTQLSGGISSISGVGSLSGQASITDGAGNLAPGRGFNFDGDFPTNGWQTISGAPLSSATTTIRVGCVIGTSGALSSYFSQLTIEIEYTGGGESGTGTDSATKEESGGTTPITGTLETGTGTDTASLAAARSGTAESGTGTDAATLATAATGAAESGTGSDAATQNYPRSSTAESGTGTDASTLAAARSGAAESGTGSDAAAQGYERSSTAESGTGTDAASLAAARSGTAESGAGSDAAAIPDRILVTVTDSGAGTDAATLAAAIAGSESGTGTDAGSKEESGSTPKAGDDTGTGTDAASLAAILPAVTEAVTGTDAAALAPAIAASDSSVGSDAANVTQYKAGTESGTGTDAATLATAIAGAAESAAGTDTSSAPVAAIAATDSGTGDDQQSVDKGATEKTGTAESGAGSDASTLAVAVTGSESGAGSDLAVVTQYKTGALETGTGTDAATLVFEPATRTDAGTGSDAASLASALSGTDAGTGTDLASLVVVLATVTDSGTGADAAAVVEQKTASDSGTGTDAASVAAGAVYITGFTRDGSGNRLGSCVVHVFRTSDDALIAETVSNGLGAYSIEVAPGVSHYVVAYKAGSPDRAGTTVNTLVGS